MITLLKILKLTKIKDGNTYEVTRAQPYAIYNNGILEILEEDLFKMFPNNGKIFVTESSQEFPKDSFGLFEINETKSFDETRSTSMKYQLGKRINNIQLLEVIDLDESITSDKSKIVEKLTNGLSIPFYVSSKIIFRTSDDFLIGPLNMEDRDGVYVVKDSNANFIQYYQQEVDIIKIIDGKNNQERLFCINTLLPEAICGWIDVADEQRVISDALKQLKDNTELGELSRKMIARLREWYASGRAGEPHLQERLKRAIEIMENNTIPNEIVESFTKLLLDLQITNEIITEQTNIAFKKEYEKFLKENERLTKECNKKKQELNLLNENYSKTSQALEFAEFQYAEFEKKMQDKIKQLKNNFSTIYADQLMLSTFPQLSVTTAAPVINKTLQGFNQFQSIIGKKLMDFEDFSNELNKNLSIFKGHDHNKILAATVFTAITLEEPIIIYGENSFELAQCIAKTVASEQTLSIIPEIDKFSLDDIYNQYKQYSNEDKVKSLIIHNPHLTSGLYSLPTYFRQSKWTTEMLSPNLIMITIDSIDEANTFVSKMLYRPLINSNDYISRFINKRNIKNIRPCQMQIETIKNATLDDFSVTVRRDFREWIEDNQDVDVEIPYQLIEWLNQLSEFVEKDIIYEASYKMFAKALVLKDKRKHEVGV